MADKLYYHLTLVSIFIGCIRSALPSDVSRNFKHNDTVLSRKRRYLVFPEGSSFQVIFDLTYPSVAIEGNVFMFGHTAAMAWELPSTPLFLNEKHLTQIKEEQEAKQKSVHPHHDYISEVKHEFPEYPEASNYDYHSSLDYTPNISDDYYSDQSNLQHPDYIDRTNTNHKQAYKDNPSRFWNGGNLRRSFFKSIEQTSFDKVNRTMAHHIQRRSRRELYRKVEKLLSALSRDGKTCILKAICQVSKLASRKGSMWEEIIKVIFRAKFDNHPDEDHYDRAFNLQQNCEELYPNCKGHVLSDLLRNKIKNKST